jgi:hypothetical protein
VAPGKPKAITETASEPRMAVADWMISISASFSIDSRALLRKPGMLLRSRR